MCIAHYYNPDRLVYLNQVVYNFLSYDIKVDIIINTNSKNLTSLCSKNVAIYIPKNLPHPYFLTWLHRACMLDLINEYDYFLYTEDDLLLPFENFVEYLKNFELLFPKYVPSFVRIEKIDGKNIVVDVQKKQNKNNIINYLNKQFISLDRPYHGFWIMPQKQLKETMTDNFIEVCTTDMSREYAASYPMWTLKKTPLVMIENGQISPLCYSYHLPNTYSLKKEIHHKFGRLEIENLID